VKAVFDTNIFISALVIPGSRAATVLESVIEGRVRLHISKAIIHEVLDVLARKFGRDAEELSRAAVFLSELGEMVSPRTTVRVLKDDPDNRILECAMAGRADVIVTGDQPMLSLGEHEGVSVISLRAFLQSLPSA
jgi:putative PIN family toxin of toxin-antitoxin system